MNLRLSRLNLRHQEMDSAIETIVGIGAIDTRGRI